MMYFKRYYAAVFATITLFISNAAVSAPLEVSPALAESVWVKIALALAVLLVLPFILAGLIKELRAEKRTLRDLDYVKHFNVRFNWTQVKRRVSDCVEQVHHARIDPEMPVVSDCMTDWYWRNQQHVYLEKWRNQGLLNVRHIKQLVRIKPLLFIHRNNGALQEGSILVTAVRANMQDYFIDKDSGELMQGHKNYHLIEKLWTFMYTEGQWRIANIEDSTQRTQYTKLGTYLPKIEETLMYYSGTKIPESNRVEPLYAS